MTVAGCGKSLWSERGWSIVFLLLFLAASAGGAQAAMVSYKAQVEGRSHSLTVTAVESRDESYISLRSLVGQLGGSCRIVAARVQVDLAGSTAWISFDATTVNSSLKLFELTRPLLRQDDEVLLGLGDVVAFFDQAFHITLTPEAASAISPPQADPALTGSSDPAAAVETSTDAGTIHTIVIDPGHGGANGGVSGPGGVLEKDVDLAVALQLKQMLEKTKTVRVVLTRETDQDVPWQERIGVAVKNDAGLFVSIHAGANYAAAAKGIELFVEAPQDPAQAVPGRAAPDVSARSRQIAEAVAAGVYDSSAAPLRGTHAVHSRVMKGLAMPALLIEVGCLSNGEEEARLQTAPYQTELAQGIAAGILKVAAAGAPGDSS